ncbi:hypothetical protein QBC40DRAFT_251646 [Triangularia verruculosa]|uniref:Uncharacterized protein n=1 Tax=Triangularia verruculosa TaxID=2587418 RepID=A0AAN7AZI4_9PEZI|nr:hypothetical protein QBC40DRAFT_251646 [Triangularia verruculosa]
MMYLSPRTQRMAQAGALEKPILIGIAVAVTVIVVSIISVIVWFLFIRGRFSKGKREFNLEIDEEERDKMVEGEAGKAG